MKYLILILIFLAPAISVAESLRKTLSDAYTNSYLLKQNLALLQGTDEDVAVSVSTLRPQISSTLSSKKSDFSRTVTTSRLTNSLSVSADMLLFDSGNKRATINSKKESVLAARQSLFLLEQNIFLDAITSRLSVIRDIEILALRVGNVELIEQELLAVNDRFDVGEVTRTEVAQAEARLAQAKSSFVEAEGNLAISRELFALAVGRQPGNLKKSGMPEKLPNDLDGAVSYGLTHHPSILEAQHQVLANEQSLSASRASFGPTVSLGAVLSDNTTYDLNGSVSLSIKVPFYKGGQLNSLLRKSYASLHASKANLAQKRLTAKKNIAQSWSELAVAKSQLLSSERQIKAAEIAFYGVREEAKLGARTTLDVLDAEQVLFDAQTNRVIFQTRSHLAAYKLLASIGKLTAKDLGVPSLHADILNYSSVAQSAPSYFSKEGRRLNKISERYND
tara:strand:+ start:1197 stop:2543 length:1347 start_codon:yes stop_codon:yes gene_type:complete